MRSYGATIRRALGRAFRVTAAHTRTGRWALALAIVASLLASVLGSPAPARAIDPPLPAGFLGFTIKSIYVIDDNDWLGKGELRFSAGLCTMFDETQCGSPRLEMPADAISAGSDEMVTLNTEVPRESNDSDGAAPITAFVVFPGQQYRFYASIYDADPGSSFHDDDLGRVDVPLNQENGWGIGTFTVRSQHHGGGDGDYLLTYQIRRIPLPDLTVHGFQFIPLDKGGQAICAQIENLGQRPSGLVPMTVKVNGEPLKEITVSALEPGQRTPYCVARSELPPQGHGLGFFIDEQHQVPEMDETNNITILSVRSVTSATPGVAGADLIAIDFKINGQAPDGKNDCKDGKNTVAVVVRNDGASAAGTFGVRLVVDGTNLDATVTGLGAGETREVPFKDVQLKKGAHTLKGIPDPEHAIAESNEGNNDLAVSVRCTDGG